MHRRLGRFELQEAAVDSAEGFHDSAPGSPCLPALHRQVEADGFQWLPISAGHLLAVADLPQHDDHRDPFDLLLVAQAATEPLILLTADAKLGRYGEMVRVV